MSMTTCRLPAAAFLDRTEATICPSLSISMARSTLISRSSTGLSEIAPPHTKQPCSCLTTSRIFSMERATVVMVSMVSAVPAGEVMAREEVLGMVSPAAATIDTTTGVVRLPGKPPTQCLSRMFSRPQSRRSPALTMASVSQVISSRSRWLPAQAEMNPAMCTLE